jgi:hypothetical protein
MERRVRAGAPLMRDRGLPPGVSPAVEPTAGGQLVYDALAQGLGDEAGLLGLEGGALEAASRQLTGVRLSLLSWELNGWIVPSRAEAPVVGGTRARVWRTCRTDGPRTPRRGSPTIGGDS